MSRAKKTPAPVPKKIDYTQWSGGDRIGKKSRAMLREMQMRAIIDPSSINADDLIEVLDNVIEVIDALKECEDVDTDPVLEEVANEIRGVEKRRVEAVVDANERVDAVNKEKADLESSKASAADDHATDIAAHCKIIDELRARAEKAEHQLTEVLSDALVLPAPNDLAALKTENEQLTRMLAAMRVERPIKTRKAKS